MVIILFILASAGFTTYLLTPQKVLYNLLYLCSSIQILIYKYYYLYLNYHLNYHLNTLMS